MMKLSLPRVELALSKTTRICILLGIDTVFFLAEIIVGYRMHSLALVADAFHMLNDILSLLVGLWAVRVAQKPPRNTGKTYTYGWQRAEILGALLNAVFLMALCLTILLEAVDRIFEVPEVKNPHWVMAVGCAGLFSNLIGLFLFHDIGHGHSHGHGHGHGEGEEEHAHASSQESTMEEGHAHGVQKNAHRAEAEERERLLADEGGNVADALPENRLGGWPHSARSTSGDPTSDGTGHTSTSPSAARRIFPRHDRRSSRGGRRYSDVQDSLGHPSSFRNEIIAAGRWDVEAAPRREEHQHHQSVSEGHNSPLSDADAGLTITGSQKNYGTLHANHTHRQPKDSDGGAHGHGGHGHSHADLNMQGVLLHVIGDALGNIGVILAAAFMWKTGFWWRHYADPAISILIAVIILLSAIPLCKSTSRILLQAVPPGVKVDKIKQDIEDLPGILSCHHLHVWQLTDTKLVASLHVQVGFDFGDRRNSYKYMELAKAIHICLHEHGIDSSTIQPEFCTNRSHRHVPHARSTGATTDNEGSGDEERTLTDPEACLMECDEDCGASTGPCCPRSTAGSREASPAAASGHGHAH